MLPSLKSLHSFQNGPHNGAIFRPIVTPNYPSIKKLNIVGKQGRVRRYSSNSLSEADFVSHPSLSEWLEDNNGMANNSFVGTPKSTNRRGLFTRTSAKKGDVLMKIPLSLVMYSVNIMNTPMGPLLPWPDMDGTQDASSRRVFTSCIALYLLHEKTRLDSKFRPWIQSLPSHVGNALDMSPSQLQILNETSGKFMAYQMREQFDEIYQDLVKHTFSQNFHMFPKAVFTKDAVRWAFNVTLSRSITTERGPILIPAMDFANNPDMEGQDNSHFETERAGGLLRATRDIEPFGEILLDYGGKSNLALMNTYGFVMNSNSNEEIYLQIDPSYLKLSKEEMFSFGIFLKKSREFSPAPVGNEIVLPITDSDVSDLIRPMRSLWMWKNKKPSWEFQDPGKKLPIDDEVQVCEFALGILNQALGKFSTTLEEDEQLFSKEQQFTERNIIQLRIEDKKALRKCISKVQEYKGKL